MPKGGRRPGAGAPKGNTNALKHGMYSTRQVMAMVKEVIPDPEKKRKLVEFLRQLAAERR